MRYDIERIKWETAKQFLSQKALAAKAKISPVTVGRIFTTGAGSAETIGKLVRALKLNPEDVLITPDTPPTPVDVPAPLTSKAEQELVVSAKENR